MAPEPTPDRDGVALATRVRLAVVRLNRRLRAHGAGSGLPLTQLAALFTLHKHGALAAGELACREGVQPPSMTRVIAKLAERGLVTRRPHPTDGRQVIVELTGAGRELIAEDINARERWLDRRLADLTEEDRDLLRRAVTLIDTIAEAQ
jgi:DNA-binding MarR family transcriptional regulator